MVFLGLPEIHLTNNVKYAIMLAYDSDGRYGRYLVPLQLYMEEVA